MSYGRTCTLRLGSREIVSRDSDDLRISFNITRDKSRDPNEATISIWGLLDSTIAELSGAERLFTELLAGYLDDGEHRIFTGVLLSADSYYDNGSRVLVCDLGDDAKEKASALATINRLFPKGTEIATVLRELVKASGLKTSGLVNAGSYARLAGSATLPRSWSASGQALGALHAFTRSLGFQYTIQNQEVIFLGLGKGTKNQGPLITFENIEGSVAEDAEGSVAFRCRMIPDLVPGAPFRLSTARKSGDFVAVYTQHDGDTHGNAWSVNVVGDPYERIATKGLRVV